jgi:hypothetical protein
MPKAKRPRENRIFGLPMVSDPASAFSFFLRQQTCTPGRRPKPKAAPEAEVKKAGKKSEHVGSMEKRDGALVAERQENGKCEMIEGVTPATLPPSWS